MDDDEELDGDAVHQPVNGDPPPDPESGQSEPASGGPSSDPLRFDRWRRRSAAGAMMTGIAFGMQEALDRKRKEPPIVQEVDGDPGAPGPIELQFDPDHPEKTVAVIRPWLMEGADTAPEEAGESDDAGGTASSPDH